MCKVLLNSLTPIAAAFAIGCSTIPPDASFWSVRRVSDGATSTIVARSRIVRANAPVMSRVESRPVTTSRRDGLVLQLRSDAGSDQDWTLSPDVVSRDAGFAADWLQRTGVLSTQPATLTLVLVDTDTSLDVTESSASNDAIALTLYVPADTSSPARMSATLRAGFATLFHEFVHVQLNDRRDNMLRREEEYMATMFESCYLIDSARITDRIRLKSSQLHPTDYALGSSSEGAADAVAELRRVAGSDMVDVRSVDALHRLRNHCRSIISAGFPKE